MSNLKVRSRSVFAMTLATVTVVALLSGIAGRAATAASKAANIGPCPNSNSIGNFVAAPNVGAVFSSNGNVTTYTFVSLENETPVKGVPGLVKYCVYTTQPDTIESAYDDWTEALGSNNFAFMRPGGNKTNFPLNGSGTTMGTATFSGSTAPEAQTILLHIADPGVCHDLYGGTSPTCFVKPFAGPICNFGDATLAYNALPYGVENCGAPSEAFQAQQTNEFGDAVTLAGTARTLTSLRVVFSSYACETSPAWNIPGCVTTPGATFTHEITANIYNPNNLTNPIATATQEFAIPFRPSADPVHCTVDEAQWFNAIWGACQYSIQKVLTFTNWTGSLTLPDSVVWTVEFNTSDYGPNPMGTQPCSSTLVGCPYDSLNVATKSFPNAPYAGTDISEAQAYHAWWESSTFFPLQIDTKTTDNADPNWTGYRPLGAITTQ